MQTDDRPSGHRLPRGAAHSAAAGATAEEKTRPCLYSEMPRVAAGDSLWLPPASVPRRQPAQPPPSRRPPRTQARSACSEPLSRQMQRPPPGIPRVGATGQPAPAALSQPRGLRGHRQGICPCAGRLAGCCGFPVRGSCLQPRCQGETAEEISHSGHLEARLQRATKPNSSYQWSLPDTGWVHRRGIFLGHELDACLV